MFLEHLHTVRSSEFQRLALNDVVEAEEDGSSFFVTRPFWKVRLNLGVYQRLKLLQIPPLGGVGGGFRFRIQSLFSNQEGNRRELR